MLSIDMVKCFNTTVTGARHIDIGKECQDASLSWHSEDSDLTIAVVSDGHGGEQYVNSARGSELACEIALNTLRELAESEGLSLLEYVTPESLHQLSCCIVSRWIMAVEEERGEDDLNTYGCTLIAYLQKGQDWLALQIGDGCFSFQSEDGIWSQPIPCDDRCFLNMTTSMCDKSAADEFRFATSREFGPAKNVFMVSDGVSNTFDDEEKLHGFFQHLVCDINQDPNGFEEVRQLIPDILSYYSRIGCGDDMSLIFLTNSKK